MEKIEKPLTDEDRLMGKTEPEYYTVTELNAFTNKVVYEVTNLELNNKPTLVYGNMIDSFVDEQARRDLEKGENEVKSKKGYLIKVYKKKVDISKMETTTEEPTISEMETVEEPRKPRRKAR